MEEVTWEQWKMWHAEGKYSLLPYVRQVRATRDDAWMPAVWDPFWQDASPYASLLESGKGGRYTIVGAHPVEAIEGKGNRAEITVLARAAGQDAFLSKGDSEQSVNPSEQDAAHFAHLSEGDSGVRRTKEKHTYPLSSRTVHGPPLETVRAWMSGWTAPRPDGFPDCCGGGIIGYLSYDVVRSLEKLPESSLDDLQLPDYHFQRYEQLWLIDHQQQAVYAVVHVPVMRQLRVGETRPLADDALLERFRQAESIADDMQSQWHRWCAATDTSDTRKRLDRMRRVLEADGLQADVERAEPLTVSMSKEVFQQAVRRIQQYIRQGDVFQVNVSLRQSQPVQASAEQLYEWLRLINPSPYMGMLRTPDYALVSASPELLVKLDGGKLSTRPIGGTRRRGRTPEEDLAMEAELRANEKERAEHIMLVDLERNDLGRVAAYGTVKVPELFVVERYSHVMHLVSQVEAELAPNKDAIDALAAMFPGGTITGAPKIRTMEIIEELEPVRRGPYTGSLGWIDYCGNMEFNIIIRTMVHQGGVCHIQAGAGIVIDSEPEREYKECLNKAKALWKTVQYASSESGSGRAGTARDTRYR